MTESPIKKDEDYENKWGTGGKTAKLKAKQWCSDNNYYNSSINDKGNWQFNASCSGSVPEGWSRPFSNEAAVENGFKDRNDAASNDCISKGYSGIEPATFREHGEFNFSVKCKQVKPIGAWVKKGCGITPTKKPAEHWWVKLDVGTLDWKIAAEKYAMEIVGTNINTKKVIEAVGRSDLTGAYVDAWTSSESCDVQWDPPVTGCDNAGSILTVQKCNNWVSNDPYSCKNSNTVPKVKKWIKCAIGSSPGGKAPGDTATICSPLSDSFNCAIAENCFAVTEITPDSTCVGPFDLSIGGSITMVVAIIVAILVLLLVVMVIF